MRTGVDPFPPIVLTTDFGLADSYVGLMKGVILSINPRAAIVDLTHGIPPQDVKQAALVLGAGWRFFPQDAIHVVVVDPGVGTQRQALLLVTPQARFLAPDNGVLSRVVAEYLDGPPAAPETVPVPARCTAYQLTEPSFWRRPVSNTFHGRDIFAPAAAHLSLGVEPAALGRPVTQLLYLPRSLAVRDGDRVYGEVVYADHFGNLITNIPEGMMSGAGSVLIEIKGRGIARLSRTFHHGDRPGQLLALIGSHGYLEIAVANGSAARELKAGPGEPVTLSYL